MAMEMEDHAADVTGRDLGFGDMVACWDDLKTDDLKIICDNCLTGSLITSTWILTAAHCVTQLLSAEEIHKCAEKGYYK